MPAANPLLGLSAAAQLNPNGYMMPRIKLPSGSGEWRQLDRQNGAELWKRVMDHPSGHSVTFYVVGSENTPEIFTDQSMQKARETFARLQLLAQ